MPFPRRDPPTGNGTGATSASSPGSSSSTRSAQRPSREHARMKNGSAPASRPCSAAWTHSSRRPPATRPWRFPSSASKYRSCSDGLRSPVDVLLPGVRRPRRKRQPGATARRSPPKQNAPPAISRHFSWSAASITVMSTGSAMAVLAAPGVRQEGSPGEKSINASRGPPRWSRGRFHRIRYGPGAEAGSTGRLALACRARRRKGLTLVRPSRHPLPENLEHFPARGRNRGESDEGYQSSHDQEHELDQEYQSTHEHQGRHRRD